ncbi:MULTISPECIES: DUF1942 domain-containing protein [Mycolicibacterium]|uniref:MPT63 family protein n=3 Tax=Mycolicibacterium TaxID=1866885 RepID=A0AAW5SHA6_MYCNV|nr:MULTISPECIES: DUF1942 domain-containing protein [Mycolicibacterium]MCV7022906.1 MPT63 family protein [Mycolicibacterium novocastrense]STZ41449.1 protein of uncharacterised function (DUF1942) [Mycolicibacterium gilvum]
MRNIVIVMAAAAAMMLLVGTGIPAAFAAAKCPHMFGSQQRVADAGAPVVQEWTAIDLQRGADLLPGYSAVGKLWEAGVSVSAMNGAVTPIIPNFQAVSRSGVRYPALWQVPSPNGIPSTTLADGQTSTGKLYFDVTADDPVALIYTTGTPRPVMMWCCSGPMLDMQMGPGMQMGDCQCKESATPCACCELQAT